MASRPAPSAALIVIGNEILSGKFADLNGPWFIERCRLLGIDLGRIVVIADDVEQIAEEVDRCRRRFFWTVTSGGVGPTHDDVTMEGVARALGQPLIRHPALVERLRTKLVERLTEDALRMADVPASAELWWEGELRFPLVVAQRVLILPGVPALFQAKLRAVEHRLGGVPLLRRQLWTLEAETLIAQRLRRAQERWPTVQIGSYPRFETHPWRVMVALDSRDEAALSACEAWLREALAPLAEAPADGD